MENINEESTFIVPSEVLKEKMKKAMLLDELKEEEEARERDSKKTLLILGFIFSILLTISICQLFLIKNVKENEKTTTTCRGGIIEVCVTKNK